MDYDIKPGDYVIYIECVLPSCSPPCFERHDALATRIYKKKGDTLIDLVMVDKYGVRTVRSIHHDEHWARDSWRLEIEDA